MQKGVNQFASATVILEMYALCARGKWRQNSTAYYGTYAYMIVTAAWANAAEIHLGIAKFAKDAHNASHPDYYLYNLYEYVRCLNH